MSRISKEYTDSLGMIYVYSYSNAMQRIVSESALKEFYNCVERNLEKLDVEDNYLCSLRNERIYDHSLDEAGKGYYILKSDFDFKKAESDYISLVPVNYLVASQMPNALECLGLVKINGNIKVKRDVLSHKHSGECCNNCEYAISSSLLEDIRRENSKYSDLTYEEIFKEIGYCEFDQDEETIKNMGYWCPKYTENANLRKKEYVLRKIN